VTDHDDGPAEAETEIPPAETARAEAGQSEPAQAEGLQRPGTGDGPDENITQPPDSTPPSVWLSVPAQAVAGAATVVTLNVDRGTNWTLGRNQQWVAIPGANFTELTISVPGIAEVRDHRSSVNSGTTHPITFPSPGNYQISGSGNTSDGRVLNATPVTVTAVTPPAPSFTWNAPANGATVDLGPSGAPLTVDLNTPAALAYPLTVQVGWDGTTSSDQDTGTHFGKTVTLAPTPLGTRSISVTVTDALNRSASQIRSITARDGAPPTVTLDPYTNPLVAQQLPATLQLTGKTSGAASGVTSVAFAVPALGTTGQAIDTAPNGDWSTWSAAIPFTTTGDGIDFTVTATDARGGTGSASAKITVQF
jgi:hypothetical protein